MWKPAAGGADVAQFHAELVNNQRQAALAGLLPSHVKVGGQINVAQVTAAGVECLSGEFA